MIQICQDFSLSSLAHYNQGYLLSLQGFLSNKEDLLREDSIYRQEYKSTSTWDTPTPFIEATHEQNQSQNGNHCSLFNTDYSSLFAYM